MSHARKREGWTSVMTADKPAGIDVCIKACAGWVNVKPGREARVRPGEQQHNEPAFVVEIREDAP